MSKILDPSGMSRRSFVAALGMLPASALVASCSSATSGTSQTLAVSSGMVDANGRYNYDQIYAAKMDGEVSLPAFDYRRMDPEYLRQWVSLPGNYKPGTLIVDTSKRHLYLAQGGDRALRYGTAVGKEGFAWFGDAVMKWKQPWPTWTPPQEMIARTPRLAEFEKGMPGGADNPLGARALYLYKDGRDTLFRIHGTNRPHSIGKAASSGCFRMINQDVIDLYERVPPGAEVYVRQTVKQRVANR